MAHLSDPELKQRLQQLGVDLPDGPLDRDCLIAMLDEAEVIFAEANPRTQAPLEGAGQDELRGRADTGGSACAVCFQEEPPVFMPCCGREGSTTRFCRRCIEIICEQGQGVGTCPGCRAYIGITNGIVERREKQAACRMCRQTKVIVNEGMCDACLLGTRFSLRYECSGCHQRQQIPHPMWRYQNSPTEFGSSSWACHKGCGDYTKWRVIPEDAARVPGFDCPDSWGRRDDWLARVRQQRLAESRGEQQPARRSSESGGCAVM